MARPKTEDLGEDFSYILRMADTDIDGLKPLATALTAVKGVGARTANQICKNTGFDAASLAGHLSVEDQEKLRLAIEGYNESVPLWMLNRQRDLETGTNYILPVSKFHSHSKMTSPDYDQSSVIVASDMLVATKSEDREAARMAVAV